MSDRILKATKQAYLKEVEASTKKYVEVCKEHGLLNDELVSYFNFCMRETLLELKKQTNYKK